MTVLKGDVTDEVTRLKRELDGDIVVYASYQLERAAIRPDHRHEAVPPGQQQDRR